MVRWPHGPVSSLVSRLLTLHNFPLTPHWLSWSPRLPSQNVHAPLVQVNTNWLNSACTAVPKLIDVLLKTVQYGLTVRQVGKFVVPQEVEEHDAVDVDPATVWLPTMLKFPLPPAPFSLGPPVVPNWI